MRFESWAGALVLAGYLASDFVLAPPISSVAIAGLALVQFAALVVFAGRREPFLLAEGAALGAVDYAAMLVGSPGAGVMLLELAGGAALVASSIAGKPLLARYAERIPLLPADRGMVGRINGLFGALLAAHGLLMLGMTLTGHFSTALAIAAFAIMYVAVVMVLRRGARLDAVRKRPRLVPGSEGSLTLVVDDKPLARTKVEGERIVSVMHLEPLGGADAEDVLRSLEVALAMQGARTVRIVRWPGDDLQLEIAGYHSVDGTHQKVLPVGRGGRRI